MEHVVVAEKVGGIENLKKIIAQNKPATTTLPDLGGLGPHKQKVLDLLKNTDLQVAKL